VTDDLPTDEQVRSLLFCVDWYGPWERLESFFFGVRRDGTLRWEVRDDPPSLLCRLGTWADSKNVAWRHRHIVCGTRPWKVWRRRG
jgi:hypothetical protein